MTKGESKAMLAWRVPKAEEAEVTDLWLTHGKFMRATHSFKTGPEPVLTEYYVVKGDEMGPDKKPTGNVLFILNETYIKEEAIAQHWDLGAKSEEAFPGMYKKFNELMPKYAILVQMNAKVLTCISDGPKELTARVGDIGVHLTVPVDKADEAEFDALWAAHEKFMRDTHVLTTDAGDDAKNPRLTHFSISKGVEFTDPMDPSKGETGKIIYTMQETYVTPEGVGGHMGIAGTQPWMADLQAKYLPKATYVDIGSTKVIATMHA